MYVRNDGYKNSSFVLLENNMPIPWLRLKQELMVISGHCDHLAQCSFIEIRSIKNSAAIFMIANEWRGVNGFNDRWL